MLRKAQEVFYDPVMKIAVIGAGPAGLFGALAAHQLGNHVELFEAHSKPGGCASFFRRKSDHGEWTFDAGATVLNALGEGQALKTLLNWLKVPVLSYEPITEVAFSLPGRDLFWLDTSSLEAQIESLAKHFPEDSVFIHQQLWRLAKSARRANHAFAKVPHLPVETWKDLWFNIGALPELLPDLGLALRGWDEPLETWLNRAQVSQGLRQWIDMNLLITLQCRADQANPYWAALALFFYPLGAGALAQGMKGFFESLLSAAKERFPVHMKTPTLQVRQDSAGLWLKTAAGSHGPYAAVLSSAPRTNTAELLGLKAPELNEAEMWTANVAYWGLSDQTWMPERAFNLHSKIGSSEEAGAEVYLSFSSRRGTRAPQGFRSVTLSTHEKLDRWTGNRDSTYQDSKRSQLSRQFKAHLAPLGLKEPVFEDYATALTFGRYTRRYKGSVGGLPMNQKGTLWGAPSQRTRFSTVLQIGDTAFPGQSVYATAVGSLAALEKLTGSKIRLESLSSR